MRGCSKSMALAFQWSSRKPWGVSGEETTLTEWGLVIRVEGVNFKDLTLAGEGARLK